MGFHVLAKHGLNKHGLKDPNLVSFGGEKNRERRERERKEEEEEKEERRASKAKLQKGMELRILVWKLNSSMDLWNSKAWFS